MIKVVERLGVVAEQPHARHLLLGVVLFLLLLRNEPIEELHGAIVLRLKGGGVDVVDGAGDVLLMLQRGLKRLQMVAEGLVGLVDGLQLHLATVLMQILAEDKRMIALLLRLDLVPMGETFLIVVGERQVQVRRIQLLANLIVDQLVHLCIHSILLQDRNAGNAAGV